MMAVYGTFLDKGIYIYKSSSYTINLYTYKD